MSSGFSDERIWAILDPLNKENNDPVIIINEHNALKYIGREFLNDPKLPEKQLELQADLINRRLKVTVLGRIPCFVNKRVIGESRTCEMKETDFLEIPHRKHRYVLIFVSNWEVNWNKRFKAAKPI